jgi:hypothetical protein
MKHRIFSLLVLGAALAMVGCDKSGPVSPELNNSEEAASLAKRTKAHVTWIADFSNPAHIVDPGKQFVDAKGVLHIRRQVFSGAPITGDLVGQELRNVFNADIELATGNGRAWGTFREETTWPARNLSGVFEGTYKAKITAGFLTGTHAGRGSGGYKGLKIKGTQEETVPGSLTLRLNSVITKKHDDDDEDDD